MEIVKIISTHKRKSYMGFRSTPVPKGMKRVMATIKYKGRIYTRHIDVEASTTT